MSFPVSAGVDELASSFLKNEQLREIWTSILKKFWVSLVVCFSLALVWLFQGRKRAEIVLLRGPAHLLAHP